MKVALVCSGLGRIDRGFEAATAGLFAAIRSKIDITLYKGGGPKAERETRVLNLPRKYLAPRLGDARAYYWEQLSFAAALCPLLLINRPDIVHYSDGRVGNSIRRFRDLFRLEFKLILWNGAPFSPASFAKEDLIQQVSPSEFERAQAEGVPSSRMKLIPYGLNCARFANLPERRESRLRFGVPEDRKVILSVAALNSSHKRIDYLVQEIAALDRDRYFLLVAGQPTNETPHLERLASEMLGANFQFVSLPNHEISEVYSAADIFVHCSLNEGLGIVLLEAMAASLPILAHDGEPFRWVIANDECLMDMTQPGLLAHRIKALAENPDLTRAAAAKNLAHVQNTFDWVRLGPKYIEMYVQLHQKNDH